MWFHILLGITGLFLLCLTFAYYRFWHNIQKAKSLGFPIAFMQFISMQIPLIPQFLGLKVSFDSVFYVHQECFEKTGANNISTVDGIDGLILESRSRIYLL
jgi:hypothetical protein